MEYAIHLCVLIGIYFILAQSYNLSFGLGRLLNLAHIASYSVGAYTTALLSTELNQPFATCIFVSISLSAFFALLIGAISIRLSHDYFALGTLAFASIITSLQINWKSLTRGVLGIPGIPRPEFWGIDFYSNQNFLYLVLAFDLVAFALLYLLFNSKKARNLRAQAENPAAIETLGKSTRAIRNDAFIISSMLAGLAGSLFAYYINYIDPSSFLMHEMVFVLSIVIIGKPGSFWGVTFATIFLVLLPEPLRFIEMSPHILGPMRQLLYATILFAVVFANRKTLFPAERHI